MNYFFLQSKRIIRLLPGMLIMIIVMALITCIGAYAFISGSAASLDKQRYKLGVVGNTDSEMISLGIYAIQSLDDSQYMIELIEYSDEDLAREALRQGKISAFVVITDEFAASLDSMQNDSQLTYYATSGQKGITGVMMDEIAYAASSIIVSSEKGICTLRQLMSEAGVDSKEQSEAINKLFLAYLSAILGRGDLVEVTELGLSDGLTTFQYYFSSLLLFFVLLLSFCAVSYFQGKNSARMRFFASRGVTAFGQLLGEYIPFLLLQAVAQLVVGALLLGGVKLAGGGSLWAWDIPAQMLFFIKMLPVVLMFSALGFLLFELVEGLISQLLIMLMLYMAMGYVSGYFYPKSFFPDLVEDIGEKLPTGIAFSYMGSLVKQETSGQVFAVILVYTAGFLFISYCHRKCIIRGK